MPLLVALIKRPVLGAARKWVVIWSGFMVTMSALSLYFALQHQNNHWMSYAFNPVAAALILWALSWWQTGRRPAIVIRLLIPTIIIAWVPIVVLLEDTKSFSLLGEPLVGMVVLVTAIYTLAARTLRETRSLTEQDWFWAAIGIAVYHGAVVGFHPVSYWLLQTRPQLVIRAMEINALVEVTALLAIAWGMTREASTIRINRGS